MATIRSNRIISGATKEPVFSRVVFQNVVACAAYKDVIALLPINAVTATITFKDIVSVPSKQIFRLVRSLYRFGRSGSSYSFLAIKVDLRGRDHRAVRQLDAVDERTTPQHGGAAIFGVRLAEADTRVLLATDTLGRHQQVVRGDARLEHNFVGPAVIDDFIETALRTDQVGVISGAAVERVAIATVIARDPTLFAILICRIVVATE